MSGAQSQAASAQSQGSSARIERRLPILLGVHSSPLYHASRHAILHRGMCSRSSDYKKVDICMLMQNQLMSRRSVENVIFTQLDIINAQKAKLRAYETGTVPGWSDERRCGLKAWECRRRALEMLAENWRLAQELREAAVQWTLCCHHKLPLDVVRDVNSFLHYESYGESIWTGDVDGA